MKYIGDNFREMSLSLLHSFSLFNEKLSIAKPNDRMTQDLVSMGSNPYNYHKTRFHPDPGTYLRPKVGTQSVLAHFSSGLRERIGSMGPKRGPLCQWRVKKDIKGPGPQGAYEST